MFACCIKQIGAQQCRKRVSQVESIQGLGGLGFFLATKQKEARSNREIWLVLRTQTCSFIHFGFRTKKMARLRASLQSESQSSLGNSVRSWLRLRSQQRLGCISDAKHLPTICQVPFNSQSYLKEHLPDFVDSPKEAWPPLWGGKEERWGRRKRGRGIWVGMKMEKRILS